MSKAGQTKAFIIEKTAPIFNKKGYEGTSMSDMTRATGLTKGSIYGNFANKDEVALAVFDFNLQKIETIIRSEMAKHETAKDKLLVYVNVYDNFLSHPFPEGGCPILNTATECDDTHPELKKRAASAIHSWKNKIIHLIEKGIASREFSKNADAEKTAITMIANIEGAIMITKLTGKMNYRTAIMENVKAMIDNL
ncbi:MAG: TetR/AcrR family transcriptional regulator [Chitinophagaceae bacterium]|nr:TetR/AcrR family transcriptional regulator [Chitinophagaceae bacterium]